LGLLFFIIQQVSAAGLTPLLQPRDRPLVIHVWASWCLPCLVELPELAEGLRKRPVDVLWIDIEPKPAAKLWSQLGRVRGKAVQLPPEDASVLQSLDPKWQGELPSTWVLDKQGMRFSRIGGSDLPALWKTLDKR
jgi:thiol-disulfide isomerase/thioredoxin